MFDTAAEAGDVQGLVNAMMDVFRQVDYRPLQLGPFDGVGVPGGDDGQQIGRAAAGGQVAQG